MPAGLNLPVVRGRALDLIALEWLAIRRRWYERLPWLGDRLFRRRLMRWWQS